MLYWRNVRPLVAEAQEGNGCYTDADVFKQINDGKWILWIARSEKRGLEGIAIGQIEQFPRERHLYLRIVTGKDYPRWVHLLADIERYAKACGCKKIAAFARPGWKRLLTNYRASHVYLERAL